MEHEPWPLTWLTWQRVEVKKSSLDSLGAGEETLSRRLHERHRTKRRVERSNQLAEVLSRREMLKCASFLSPLLAILVTSVWLQQPGFSRLFRVTQKALIGIHSGLQADSSIAPTPTITASRGHSFWRYCAVGPAPIQTLHKWKHTGAPEIPPFPRCGFFSRHLWHWKRTQASASYWHGGVCSSGVHTECLLCWGGSRQIFKEDGFSHSLHW